jgi:hypothetical protein
MLHFNLPQFYREGYGDSASRLQEFRRYVSVPPLPGLDSFVSNARGTNTVVFISYLFSSIRRLSPDLPIVLRAETFEYRGNLDRRAEGLIERGNALDHFKVRSKLLKGKS